MSSSLKKIERKQELKKRKNARKSMRIMERVFDSMPKECVRCSRPFDPTSPRALDEWRANIGYEGMTIMCPICSIGFSVQQKKL